MTKPRDDHDEARKDVRRFLRRVPWGELYSRYVTLRARDYLKLIEELPKEGGRPSLADARRLRLGETSVSRYSKIREALRRLAKHSESNPFAFDVASELLATLMERNKHTPDELKGLASALVRNKPRGKRPKSKEHPKRRPERPLVELVIRRAVMVAIEAEPGLRQTSRNPNKVKDTACFIVAECLPEVGIDDIGHEGVRKICRQPRQRSASRDEIAKLLVGWRRPRVTRSNQ